MKEITIRSSERNEVIDVTNQVKAALKELRAKEGLCVVYVPHTTAGVMISENADPDVSRDILEKLTEIAPYQNRYRHTEGNSDAHIKSVLVGCSVTVPVRNGELAFGTWQGIFFCEFDGPRTRRAFVQFVAAGM